MTKTTNTPKKPRPSRSKAAIAARAAEAIAKAQATGDWSKLSDKKVKLAETASFDQTAAEVLPVETVIVTVDTQTDDAPQWVKVSEVDTGRGKATHWTLIGQKADAGPVTDERQAFTNLTFGEPWTPEPVADHPSIAIDRAAVVATEVQALVKAIDAGLVDRDAALATIANDVLEAFLIAEIDLVPGEISVLPPGTVIHIDDEPEVVRSMSDIDFDAMADEVVHRTSPMPVVLQLVSDHIADRAAAGQTSIFALTQEQQDVVELQSKLDAANLRVTQAEDLTMVVLHDSTAKSRLIGSQTATIANLKLELDGKQDACNKLAGCLAEKSTEVRELTDKVGQLDVRLFVTRSQLSSARLETERLQREVDRLSEANLDLASRSFLARLLNRRA